MVVRLHPSTPFKQKVTMSTMQFPCMNEYQEYAKFFDTGAEYPVHAKTVHVLGLAGEAGEVVEKFKKHLRDGVPMDIADLAKELGDILWYVAVVARDHGLHLADIAELNLTKLQSRHDRNVLGGSGDNR